MPSLPNNVVITRLWPKLESVWSIATYEGRTEEIHAAIRLMRNVRKINWAWRCLVESSLAWIAYRLTGKLACRGRDLEDTDFLATFLQTYFAQEVWSGCQLVVHQ
jgi:hypothetical protein